MNDQSYAEVLRAAITSEITPGSEGLPTQQAAGNPGARLDSVLRLARKLKDVA